MFIKEDECYLLCCCIMYTPLLGISESLPGEYIKYNVKKKKKERDFHDMKSHMIN